MNALQGYVLFSSDRGGMRIEYAKNKMGELPQTVTVRAAFCSLPQTVYVHNWSRHLCSLHLGLAWIVKLDALSHQRWHRHARTLTISLSLSFLCLPQVCDPSSSFHGFAFCLLLAFQAALFCFARRWQRRDRMPPSAARIHFTFCGRLFAYKTLYTYLHYCICLSTHRYVSLDYTIDCYHFYLYWNVTIINLSFVWRILKSNTADGVMCLQTYLLIYFSFLWKPNLFIQNDNSIGVFNHFHSIELVWFNFISYTRYICNCWGTKNCMSTHIKALRNTPVVIINVSPFRTWQNDIHMQFRKHF